MSDTGYIEVFEDMTERQKKIMYELYMKGFNANGHVWVTYGDVEKAVGELLSGEEKVERVHGKGNK